MTLPTQISQVFQDFYASLYNLPSTSSSQIQIDEYIISSQLPSLSPEIREELNAPITLEEVEHAISSAKPGKGPRIHPSILSFSNELDNPICSSLGEILRFKAQASKNAHSC